MQLACLEAFDGGSAAAGKLLSEALYLAQGLDIGGGMLAGLLILNGIFCWMNNRAVEGDSQPQGGCSLGGTSWGHLGCLPMRWVTWQAVRSLETPDEAATNARAAVEYSRRIGNRRTLALATTNLAFSLLLLGDWDGAAQCLGERTGLDDPPEIRGRPALRGCLSALRGDIVGAGDAIGGLRRFSVSESVQDQAFVSTTQALVWCRVRTSRLEALAYARARLLPSLTCWA